MIPLTMIKSFSSPTLLAPNALLNSSILMAFYDASDASTIYLNGTSQTQFDDKSGNSKNLTQSVASVQPVYNSANKSIYFSGANGQHLIGSYNLGWSGNQDSTLIALFKKDSDIIISGGSAIGCYCSQNFGDNGRLLTIRSLDTSGGNYNNNQPVLRTRDQRKFVNENCPLSPGNNILFVGQYSGNWNSTNTKIWANGVDVSSTNLNTGTMNFTPGTSGRIILGCDLGSSANQTANFFRGNIYTFLIIKGLLTTSQRQIIEGWATHNFNLSNLLPSDHPYKLNPAYA